jgi:hypothetical protein
MRKIRFQNHVVILVLLVGGFIVSLPVKASEELYFPGSDAFWEALMEAAPGH